MKKSLSTRHMGVECTEANIKKYANCVFAVSWITANGDTCTIFCTKLVPYEPFKDWFSARVDGDREVRSFFINDKDVRILIK